MNEEEINELKILNCSCQLECREVIREQFDVLAQFLNEKHKENAKHYHFKTKIAMKEAMNKDLNPWNTFSYGKKAPDLNEKE